MKNLFGCLSEDGNLTPESGHAKSPRNQTGSVTGPVLASSRGITCAVRGWPSYRGRTGLTSEIAKSIAEDFRDLGPNLLHHLKGAFAIVLVDSETRRLFAAIDRLGQEQICYRNDRDSTVVGTSPKDVATSSRQSVSINPQAVHDFMLSHMISAPDSIFTGVRKLTAGHYLDADPAGLKITRYWHPDFAGIRNRGTRDPKDAVLDRLEHAIKVGGPGKNSGAFLSGGLDSSTVTGLLARVSDSRAKAFSVGFGIEQYDELQYARIAARHFDCEHLEYTVVPNDIVDLVPRIAHACDEPFGNSSAIPTFCCARLAVENGVDHLYAGDGGDELFGGNERYARQRIFEYYQRIPKIFRSRLINPIASRLDPDEGWLPLQKFASYVRQARDPLPDRFESWNLIYREGASNVFHQDFLSGVDPDYPLKKMRSVWTSCPSDDLLDKMLWYDWKFTLADSDIPKVSGMCELAGVRVSYPMLDDDLVELSIEIPSSDKIRSSNLRAFFKDAVKGFLPDATLTKHKHGFGLPFGVWLKTDEKLQELVYGTLAALRSRRIFDDAFIERVTAEHRDGHAGYYGYAIWDLVMLEQWLQSHGFQVS